MFLPDAAAHARRRTTICASYGLQGIAPLGGSLTDWRDIYGHCVALMHDCDIVIANLTPFRGASADAGTLVELGWFLGRDRPVFGYSNGPAEFAERNRRQRDALPDPLPGLASEEFGLSDNLMIAGACSLLELPAEGEQHAFDSLTVFERCVAKVARHLSSTPRSTR